MTISALRPADFPWLRPEGYTFSLGLGDGTHAWLSGHSASRYDAGAGRIVVTGGMGEQTELAYTKIGRILTAAGLGFHDVTHVVENVTVAGVGAYAQAEEVRKQVFREHAPTLSTVVVDRLLRPAALVEIEVSASAGGGAVLAGGDSGRWQRGTVRRGADDCVFLPTIVPIDAAGAVVAAGDLSGQYAYCLDRAGDLLRAVGLDLSHVVKTVDYTTPATRAAYPACGQVRRSLLGPVYPAAAGILMSGLHAPGVLVALDVTASRHPPEAVNPGWSRYDTLTYSPAVRAGRTLYLSGFAAFDPDARRAVGDGDVVAQARFAYQSVLRVLAAAGAGPEHLVRTVEYVCPAGLRDYRGVGDVRRALLRPPWPASTGIVCAALLRPEFLFEVDPTAVLPR